MGTVGLSFGSPTSGQGFDVTSTVSQIVTNMQAVETPWKNQLSALQSQDTVLSSIGSDLSSLSSALQSLTDFAGVLSEKQGSSSDTSVLQLTSASTSAIAGSHTITVQGLATTSSYVSSTVSGSSDTLTGSLTVNGQTINIDSTNNTLSSLASAINSGSYGVIANVITDSSGSRLSLVSKTSGASGQISISSSLVDSSNGSSAVTFTQTQAGTDAQLTVDGVSISSPSNTVTNAIQGVTFQLLAPSSNGEQVQVIITNSNSAVESAINSFVSAYNKVVQDLNTQEGKDASGNPEPLYGSPTLTSLQEALQSALNFTQTSGAITSLSQLGVTAGSDGTLSINSDTLDSVLNTNYQDVVNFFQPSGTFTSFGGNLTSVLNNLSSSSSNGAIRLALQQNAAVEQQLDQNISNEETIISAKKTELTAQLNEANYILTSIPQQLQQIDEIYSAITGYNQKQ